jgi:hypothetical protein
MPITNQTYAKYYSNPENREKLLKKMRERYDSEKRKQKYAENRDEIRERERDNYKKRKIESSRRFYTALWESHCATEDAKNRIRAFIDSDAYKVDSAKQRQFWVSEVQKSPSPDAITSVMLVIPDDE